MSDPAQSPCDVFLRHNPEGRVRVRRLAERLREKLTFSRPILTTELVLPTCFR